MLSASNLGNTPKEMAEELILKHQVAFEVYDAKVKALEEAEMYKDSTSVVIVEWWEQVIEEIKKI
jgi:hypothetical protein